ncbi:MAG: GAF domain-containing sensor histidine kinase [Candidatus Limnocylindrales bacterium]|jgi:signal transduction histidine kinase
MSAPHSTPNASRDSTGLLGLREMSAALEAWLDRPSPDSHAFLTRAFEAVISSSGLGGGHLHLEAPPLPEVELRAGSLLDQSAETAGLRSYQLRFDDRVLATLGLDAPPAAVFAVDECARGLEIVIGSAWSRARAGQASDELEALDTATRGIAGVLDLDRVLQLITDRVRELAHAQYAALGIVDQEGGIERFMTSGISRAERERIGPPPRGHGLLGVIARETHPVRVHDVATDTRRYGFPANHPAMHSLLGVPIGAKGRSIGRLYLTNKLPLGDFTEDDERLVEMFALHAGIAIENARLHEQVQRLAIVEERERIGRDLHDGIIQSIYAVGLSLEDVPELMTDEPDVARARVERAIDSLDQSIRDIRNFIFGLRPELLEQAGLVGGLAALADEFRVNSMVDVDLDTAGLREADLPADLVGQLLSIAREALSNIARHSKATRGSVHVGSRNGSLELIISDNGVGFDTAKPRAAGHQGLVNMRARASSVGGRLDVKSEPGLGTRIIVAVPRPEVSSGVADRGEE